MPRRQCFKIVEFRRKRSERPSVQNAQISARIVMNSSRVKFWPPITRFKWNLNDFTPASQIPPKFSDLGGINFTQLILKLEIQLDIDQES
ncbi:hypothetical protein AVEN_209540-1 [Araneus ventricosus]|uniref:Uncharacterized protein n=1 Tax=Araneus ventricosus TaxID=182803 RepID=A0A4Y2H671_ARAVE|nr:hypothetical protein AVEN_127302-1 [Araneus ventricosus]GBM60621.1 hypothetical protein AVEN_209540-1 [Araneus ventricosus]